jgi:putative transposase
MVASRPASIAELTDDPGRLEEMAERFRIVRLMETGLSAAAALERLDMKADAGAVRRAQRIFQRYQATGSVVNLRWTREVAPYVLTPLAQETILRYYNGRRSAGPKAVARMVQAHLRAMIAEAEARGEEPGIAIPSVRAIADFIQHLPAPVKAARGGDFTLWKKQYKWANTLDDTDYANQKWQVDHTRLDIWIRAQTATGEWAAVQVWLTVLLDVHSRAVAGWYASTDVPTAATTGIVLRGAILPKKDPDVWPVHGLPEIVVPDHGADFKSNQVAQWMQALGIQLQFTPPNCPNLKGEIERFFSTLKYRLSELSGYMGSDGKSQGAAALRIPRLLTLTQLRHEIQVFVDEYHAAVHRIIGEEPIALWQRSVRLRSATFADLDILLERSDRERVITKQGVRFGLRSEGGFYLAPELGERVGERVQVRYTPEDLGSIRLYSSPGGKFICEAFLEGTQYPALVVNQWREADRRAIRDRTKGYAREVDRDDTASAEAWDEAVTKAASWEDATPELNAPQATYADASASADAGGTTDEAGVFEAPRALSDEEQVAERVRLWSERDQQEFRTERMDEAP